MSNVENVIEMLRGKSFSFFEAYDEVIVKKNENHFVENGAENPQGSLENFHNSHKAMVSAIHNCSLQEQEEMLSYVYLNKLLSFVSNPLCDYGEKIKKHSDIIELMDKSIKINNGNSFIKLVISGFDVFSYEDNLITKFALTYEAVDYLLNIICLKENPNLNKVVDIEMLDIASFKNFFNKNPELVHLRFGLARDLYHSEKELKDFFIKNGYAVKTLELDLFLESEYIKWQCSDEGMFYKDIFKIVKEVGLDLGNDMNSVGFCKNFVEYAEKNEDETRKKLNKIKAVCKHNGQEELFYLFLNKLDMLRSNLLERDILKEHNNLFLNIIKEDCENGNIKSILDNIIEVDLNDSSVEVKINEIKMFLSFVLVREDLINTYEVKSLLKTIWDNEDLNSEDVSKTKICFENCERWKLIFLNGFSSFQIQGHLEIKNDDKNLININVEKMLKSPYSLNFTLNFDKDGFETLDKKRLIEEIKDIMLFVSKEINYSNFKNLDIDDISLTNEVIHDTLQSYLVPFMEIIGMRMNIDNKKNIKPKAKRKF